MRKRQGGEMLEDGCTSGKLLGSCRRKTLRTSCRGAGGVRRRQGGGELEERACGKLEEIWKGCASDKLEVSWRHVQAAKWRGLGEMCKRQVGGELGGCANGFLEGVWVTRKRESGGDLEGCASAKLEWSCTDAQAGG
jgi:hypothetical protein